MKQFLLDGSVDRKHSRKAHSRNMSIQSNISKESNAESLDSAKMDGAKDLSYNTKNPILNPQEEVPDVISKYTVIKDKVEAIDLNEDRWSTDYYVVFFHTGWVKLLLIK